MPTPARNWSYNLNNEAGPDSPVDAYQETLFGLKEAFRLAGTGATNVRSSNGTTHGTGDNIASASDFALGTPGSWWTAQLGVDVGGGDVHVLLATNEASVTQFAASHHVTYGVSVYPFEGGDLTTLPSNVLSSSNQRPGPGTLLLPNWGSEPGVMWHTLWSDAGDVIFTCGVRHSAVLSVFASFLVFNDTPSGGGGQLPHRFVVGNYATSGTGVAWHANNFGSSWWSAWRALSNGFEGVQATSPGLDFAPPEGTTDTGEIATFLATWVGSRRIIGQHPDITICRNLPFGSLDDAEAGQDQRRMSVGDVMLFFPSNDLLTTEP